jgi:glycerol-3-phosphate dehydrogenase
MQLRQSNIDKLSRGTFDVLIVGGGINGAVSAAALAGRGVKTALIDMRDFAGFTSMQSSNLAWGGIKYLESHDYALVRELCKSRNRLMRNYPSTVQEMRFLTTLSRGFRFHPVVLWVGAWLYWLMGDCHTRVPRLLTRKDVEREEGDVDTRDCIGGIEYSDAYLHDNDARFTFNFVRSAMTSGCIAANYVESLGGQRDNGVWTLRARDAVDNAGFTIKAKVLINAAGPFVDAHNRLTGQTTEHHHAFSKGIHLLVDRIKPRRRVLAFFADDGRLFFAIPMGLKTCVGTTDTRVDDPLVHISEDDLQFVLDNINKRLKLDKPLSRRDIVAYRCGVRPLAVKTEAEGSRDFLQLSRKHALDVNLQDAHVSIFGGKLTDCINVGNEVCGIVAKMGVHIPQPGYKWYGEPPNAMKQEFLHRARLMDLDAYTPATSTESLSTRLWRRYGLGALGMLESIREDPRQAELLIGGTEYIRCELHQAAHREMITKLEDFLRRRSKIALVVRKEEILRSPGLLEACSILFGDQARAKLEEYARDDEGLALVQPAASARAYVDRLSAESHADNRAHSESLEWRAT